MRIFQSAILLGLAFVTAFVVGCGEKSPEFGQVEGVVKIKGKPKSGIAVRFLPDPTKGNDLPINATGTSDESGKYRLHYVFKGKEGDGAPVGWNRVMLDDTRLGGIPQGAPIPPRLFPAEYGSSATTPLSFEVKPGPQTIDLEVP
jgi:hypothetical protein